MERRYIQNMRRLCSGDGGFLQKINLNWNLSNTKVIIPSSVAIDSRTNGLAEYIKAKQNAKELNGVDLLGLKLSLSDFHCAY